MTGRASPSAPPLLGERIARHGLGARPDESVEAAVARTTAVQAQDAPASRLGVRARAPVDDAAVRRAIEDDRTIVRTWLMRGTIHLVPAADLRWLVRLFGPAVIRKFRTRWRQLGLGDELLDRYAALLADVLKAGPMTRREIKAAAAEQGVRLESPDPQAHTHAVVYASSIGLVCRGPDRGRDSTFTLLDEWLPDAPAGPEGDDALAELARRYFAAYSPATAADFTTWAGLGSGRAIGLIRDELTPVEVDGRPGFRLGEVEPDRGVRLLPAFDNYLLGYRDRAAIVAPEWQPRVYHGGLIRPTVLVDGRVTGSWRLDRTRGEVALEPFEPWPAAVRRAVEAEVADVARFLGREVTIVSG
jgi:hypothetical protein